jgi:hypothetical protein
MRPTLDAAIYVIEGSRIAMDEVDDDGAQRTVEEDRYRPVGSASSRYRLAAADGAASSPSGAFGFVVLHCPRIVAIELGVGRLGVCVGSHGGVGSCEESEYGGLEQPAGVAGPWAAVQSTHGSTRGVESKDRGAVGADDPC